MCEYNHIICCWFVVNCQLENKCLKCSSAVKYLVTRGSGAAWNGWSHYRSPPLILDESLEVVGDQRTRQSNQEVATDLLLIPEGRFATSYSVGNW